MKKLILTLFLVFSFAGGGFASEGSFVYDDNGKRDPMWPLVSSGGSIQSYETDLLLSDMVLEGIIVEASGSNLAIINGVIVKTNDTLGKYKIKSISQNTVVVKKGEEEFSLRLKSEN